MTKHGTGTFLCWLWGHKYIGTRSCYLDDRWQTKRTWKEVTTWCVRCGKPYQDNE